MIEARAIRGLLGSHAENVLLSATKSMTGHLLGGAGALESVFTIKALESRTAPPTINVTSPDPELEVDLVFLAICTPRFRPEAYEDVEGAASR